MLGIICTIIGICLFGGLICLSIKESNEARKLYRRKVEALEVIAIEIRNIRRTKYNLE